MPKRKFVKKSYKGEQKDESLIIREKYRFYYIEKFFNKFLSLFKFTGIDYQQRAYIMRKFWSEGTIAVIKDSKSGLPVFAPWFPADKFNTYDYPTKIGLVNVRGVSFIPSSPLYLDEEGGACIGYIQRNRKGIYSSIEIMIEKLVNIEMTIRTNLKSAKSPWVIGVSPEDEARKEFFVEQLDSDSPYIFVGLDGAKDAKALVSGGEYNIDKLEAQRQQVENEILTRLGIQNVGIMEKKEHFTVDEVNSNNEQINTSGYEFIDCLNEFFDNARQFLGIDISVKLIQNEENKIPEMEEEGE